MMQFILLCLSLVHFAYGALTLTACNTGYANLTNCKLSGYC